MDTGRQGRTTDRRAFERLVLPHLDHLSRHALALTHDPDEAADVVQDTCLRAWRYFASFRTGFDIRGWLYRILYRVFLSHRGPGSRRMAPWPATAGAMDCLLYDRLVRDGGWKDPMDANPVRFGRLLGDEITAALARLPAAYSFPLLLCDLDDLTYREIAVIVRCPINTVRTRIARGRRRLEWLLAEYARRQGYFKPSRRHP